MDQSLPTIGWGVFLRPHPLAFVLFCGFVGWSAWRWCREAGPWRARAVASLVWAFALVVAFAQLLSLVRQLHWPGLLALSGAAVLLSWRASVPSPSQDVVPAAPDRPRDHFLLIVIGLPALAYGVFALALTLGATEPCSDNALYHLPRLGYWLQHQSLQPFLANNPRLGSFPPNGNLPQLIPVLFLRSDGLAALVQLAAFYGTGLALFGVARDLGATRVASAIAALCWWTVPIGLLQATVSMVDVTTSFYTVAAGAFAVAAARRGGRVALATCLLASALAVGAKPQVALFVVPAAAFAMHVRWRVDVTEVRSVVWLAPALFLIGAWPYVQNLLFFGSVSGLRSVAFVVVNPGLPSLAKNLQLMGAHLVSWRRHGWGPFFIGPGLGALWLILVPAGLGWLAWRRLRRGERGPRERFVFLALALVLLVAILFTMRHQPSVTRFVLPPVAALCVAAAFAIDGLAGSGSRRAVTAVAIAGAATVVMWRHGEHDLRGRLTDEGLACVAAHGPLPRCLAFRTPEAMCGAYHERAGIVASSIGATADGRRIGLVGSQGFPERLLFGRRFSNVLVPLSYRLARDPAELDRAALDVVWVEGAGRAPLTLFRTQFSEPDHGPETWAIESFGGSDAAFEEAVGQCVTRFDPEAVRRELGRSDAWVRCKANPAGVFFTRAGLADSPCWD